MRLTFLVKIGCLILLRSWRTTLVLSFMLVVAVASLVFLSALAVGTNDAMISNSTGLFSGHISGKLLRQDDIAGLQGEGVATVLVRRQQQVVLAGDAAFVPLLLIGIEPARERAATAFWQKIVAGRYPEVGEEAILLGEATAKGLGLAVGDRVALGQSRGAPEKTLTLVGIYRTGITQLDQGLAFCPVKAMPEGENELAVAVFLKDGVSVETVVARYRQALPGAVFAGWPEFLPDLKQLIDLDAVCMAIVIILVFAVVAVGISCTFLIFTLKNLREHGIMKAMGLTATDTALLLVAQIGLLTFFAAGVGALVGVATVAIFAEIGIDISAFTSHNQYFSVSGMLYPRLTQAALFVPPGVAMIFALLAAVWPIVYVIRKNPADILRLI